MLMNTALLNRDALVYSWKIHFSSMHLWPSSLSVFFYIDDKNLSKHTFVTMGEIFKSTNST